MGPRRPSYSASITIAEVARADIVSTSRCRDEERGEAGLLADRPRAGRPKQITLAMKATIIEATLHTPPPDQGTHCSTCVMAAVADPV